MMSNDAHVQLLRTIVTNYQMRFASGSKPADKPREILSTGTDARGPLQMRNCRATVVDRAVVATTIGEHATSVVECGTARMPGGSFDLYERRASPVKERDEEKMPSNGRFRAIRL
jgi:hypothetical protein